MQVPGLSPLRIALTAPAGRMGRAIAQAIADDTRFVVDDATAQVLIDFSAPAALASAIDRARTAAIPLIVGTTGLDDLADARLAEAARDIPVLRSANMSLGVTLLAHLVEQAAARLGPAFDIEILEMHHAAKRDAPSGTALLLGAAAARGRGTDRFAPIDRDGLRAPGSIGYASLRGGTVAGDHDVIFAGPGERVILSHRAEGRDVFARGALAAALWIAARPPGAYAMEDVLGLVPTGARP